MAKFLQDTLQEMAVSSRNPKKKKAVQEFAEFFDRVNQLIILSNEDAPCRL